MFGDPKEKGKISYCRDKNLLDVVLHGKSDDRDLEQAFQYNLSYTFFKKRKLHEALATDPYLCDVSNEWCRTVDRNNVTEMMLCCPEDVLRSTTCVHGAEKVCKHCEIPVCHECLAYLMQGQKIPKPFCNDNYVSYQHQYIVDNKVT